MMVVGVWGLCWGVAMDVTGVGGEWVLVDRGVIDDMVLSRLSMYSGSSQGLWGGLCGGMHATDLRCWVLGVVGCARGWFWRIER